jgi:hypothetical protein
MGIWVCRHATWCVVIFSAIYWFVALRHAAHDIYGDDELTTWFIARLPSLSEMWRALLGGFEKELPLTHLLVRLSNFLFGASHLASRLPSAVGFWVGLLSVYLFLKRYLAAPYALAGMIFPVATLAWDHVVVARAYAVLLGATGFAMVCWQTATSGSRLRKPALAGITVGLTIALSTHVMAIMLALPFALGELLRSIQRRRIDFPVWAAFALSAPVLLIYPPMLAAGPAYDLRGMYPTLGAIPDFYGELLTFAVFPVLAALLAVYLVGRDSGDGGNPALPFHIVAALVVLASLPAIFIVIAFATRHFFFLPRYGLHAVIPLAVLLAVAASHACRGSVRSGMAILLVFAAWAADMRVKPTLRHMPPPTAAFDARFPLLREALRGDLPVVVTEPNDFGLAGFYLPPPDADRLHYLIDLENARRSPFEDLGQRNMTRGRVYLHTAGSVEAYSAFLLRNRRFVLHVDNRHPPGWLYYLLARDRCVVTLRNYSGGESLFTVDVAP